MFDVLFALFFGCSRHFAGSERPLLSRKSKATLSNGGNGLEDRKWISKRFQGYTKYVIKSLELDQPSGDFSLS